MILKSYQQNIICNLTNDIILVECEADYLLTKCAGSTDCLYTNCENCNTFIQCHFDNEKLNLVVIPCPTGLEWNDNLKRCDYHESSTCNK
jgi:hypothetical protein